MKAQVECRREEKKKGASPEKLEEFIAVSLSDCNKKSGHVPEK